MTRVGQLQQALGEQGVDALFLRLPENVMLATGWWVQIGGLGIVVVPREGEATLLIPEYEAAEVARYWPGDVRTFPAIRFDWTAAGDRDPAAARGACRRARPGRRLDWIRGEL